MTCQKCNKDAVANNLCKEHYIASQEEIYLDNTDFSDHNKGIIRWSRDFLPQYVPQDAAKIHEELYQIILGLYNPYYINKYERLANIVAYRGSGKSTCVNMIIPSYIIAHNGMKFKITINDEIVECLINESFIVIISETGEMAEDFSVRIRDEFELSKSLRYFYTFVIEDAVDGKSNQWTRKSFKINKTYVAGVGTKQQIRGKIKEEARATLVIPDDIYSENNTQTKASRNKIRKWWNNAVMNSIDDLRGKVAFCGTIVDEDTINVSFMKSKTWKTHKVSLMDLTMFKEFERDHIKINHMTGACALPFDEVDDEFERAALQRKYYFDLQNSKDWKLSWAERSNLYFLAVKYREAMESNMISGFYQEYFHIVVSDFDKRFKPEYFKQISMEYNYEFGTWWIKTDFYAEPLAMNVEIGIDVSAGLVMSDDTVITITGITGDNRRFVLDQIVGRFSMRDILPVDESHYGKICMDRSLCTRVGYIDELARQTIFWKPKKVKMGVGGQEQKEVEETQRVFRENGIVCMVLGRPQTRSDGDKIERIKNGLLPYYETGMVYHKKGLFKLENELEYLGKGESDNCPDSLEVAFWDIQKPELLKRSFYTQTKKVPHVSDWIKYQVIESGFNWRTS